jgi:hypothetical protein
MNKTILAIDPGASGGVALVQNGTILESAHGMWPTEGDIVEGLRMIRQSHSIEGQLIAFVEEVGGFIGFPMPGSRMFTFGRGFGFLLGVLQTLGYRVELVKPQKWQKALGLGNSGKVKPDLSKCATELEKSEEKKRVKKLNAAAKVEWKNKLKAEAQRRFPHLKVTLETADALLLLEYGRMIAK